MINRRILALGAAAGSIGVPLLLRAQPGRQPRVVWVGFGPLVPGDQPILGPWHRGFQDLGYVEGRNISLEYRYVEAAPEGRAERLADLLATLVQQNVDVLFSPRPEVVLAAMRATRTIPIVFATIGDPVGTGLVDTLARPGGNVTGISFDSSPEIAGKQLQLLHELVPRGHTLGMLLWHSIDGNAFVRAAQAAGNAMGVQLLAVEVREAGEFDAAFASLASHLVAGTLVLGSAYNWVHRERLAALAAKHRMPAIYGVRDAVVAGGLMAYGPNLADEYRRAAIYIDKILKGTKPADLPVEQPTKFEFVVNLQAARVLGITIPQAMLVRADEVIQ